MDDTPTAALTRRSFLKAAALATAALAFPSNGLVVGSERICRDVPFHYQRHALTYEMAALRMAAEYHGVVRSEDQLLHIMLQDPRQPRFEDGAVVWTDANRVFPGVVTGWQLYRGGMKEHPRRARRGQWGYGIHAPGVAEVAVQLGLRVEVFDEVDHVYVALDRGLVPIVIVPHAGRVTAVKWSWFTPGGKAVDVINGEHSVVVKGYDARRVWVNDPTNKVAVYDRGRFERAFSLLRSGVTIGPPVIHQRRRYVPV